MRLKAKLTNFTRSKITPYVAVILIVIISVFSSMPGKSCEKQDSLQVETKEIKTTDSTISCDKDQVNKEKEKFNMMSLNLVYYLMNKFIDSGIPKE